MPKRKEIEKTIDSVSSLKLALAWVEQMAVKGLEAGPVVVRLGRERRTMLQNSKLWPMLTDLSRQIEWGGKTLTPESWKEVVTGSMAGQEMLPAIGGGFIMIGRGKSTSKMNKKELADVIEFMYAEFSDQVTWSDPQEKEASQEHSQAS